METRHKQVLKESVLKNFIVLRNNTWRSAVTGMYFARIDCPLHCSTARGGPRPFAYECDYSSDLA